MVKSLPTTYLGLPLSLKGLTKAQLDPFILKFASRSACWKGNLMAKSGRLVLLKANLIPLVMYWMSVFKLPIWAQKLLVRMPLVKEDLDLDSGSGWFTFAAADEVGWAAKLREMAAKLCFHGDNAEKERTALHHVSYDLGDLA
ncbi:hypothetical protein D1007_21332 [Hordeum vulgare]|nr:hypothetical protein D1007_21332 [Hordeum vulgare]